MIIVQSKHLRVFNGEGYDQGKPLLLKYLNLYSSNNWIKTVHKVKSKLKINLNLKDIILMFFKSLAIKFSKFNKNIFFMYKKFSLTVNSLNLIKTLFFNNIIFSKFFKLNSNLFNFKKLTKNLYRNELHKFLVNSFMPKRYLDPAMDNRFKLRQRDYKKKLKNISLKIENLNNNNIFISGQVFDYYKGSITPFYNSKYSWFASTGLKSDVECHDLEVDTIINKEAYLNMYIDPFKDIIFKLRNFKFQVTKHIKNKVRTVFFYKLHNFYGLQRFFSESTSSFNYKQNYNQLLNLHFSLFYLKSSLVLKTLFLKSININNKFFKKKFNNNIYRYGYTGSIYLNLTKLIFFLVKLMGKFYFYYNYVKVEMENLSNSSEVIYRSLFSFLNIEKINVFILKVLITNFFNKNLCHKFLLKKLVINTPLSHFAKTINIFLSLYLNFSNFIIIINKYLNKQELLRIFFDIFLIGKYKTSLKKSLYKTTSLYDQINLQIALLEKTYWFFISKTTFYYMFFFLEWKINLTKLFFKGNITGFYILEEKLLQSFVKLKAKWFLSKFLFLKEFYFFFLEFFNNLLLNCQKIFYFSKNFLKNKKFFNYKFSLTNIYIYLYNRRKQEFLGNDLLLSNNLVFVSNFLGQWFYYRQKQFFADNKLDNFYHNIKPYRGIGFNLLESNIYNLNCYGSNLNTTLDIYFKENINRCYNININKVLIKYKSTFSLEKNNLISDMYSKIFKVRNFFFSRNLNKLVDSSLRSLFNLKLPASVQRLGYLFYKIKDKSDNFNKLLIKKKFLLSLKKNFFQINFTKKDISFINSFLLLHKNYNNLSKRSNYFLI